MSDTLPFVEEAWQCAIAAQLSLIRDLALSFPCPGKACTTLAVSSDHYHPFCLHRTEMKRGERNEDIILTHVATARIHPSLPFFLLTQTFPVPSHLCSIPPSACALHQLTVVLQMAKSIALQQLGMTVLQWLPTSCSAHHCMAIYSSRTAVLLHKAQLGWGYLISKEHNLNIHLMYIRNIILLHFYS